MADDWLEVEAAARYLGVRPAVIWRLIHDGALEARGFPPKVRRDRLVDGLEHFRIRPGELAHMDPNAAKRAKPGTVAPVTRRGVPDRRYGRR